MGFPASHQPKSCITPNFPKMGYRYLNLTFFCINFDEKLKVCYQVSLSKTSDSKVVARSTTYRTLSTFW